MSARGRRALPPRRRCARRCALRPPRLERDAVGIRRRQRCDRVGDSGSGGGDDHPGTTTHPGVAVRGIPRTLLVPGDDMSDAGPGQVAVELRVVVWVLAPAPGADAPDGPRLRFGLRSARYLASDDGSSHEIGQHQGRRGSRGRAPWRCRHRVRDRGLVRIALFVTCLGDVLFPDVGKATVALLERLGNDVEFPPGADLLWPDAHQHGLPGRRHGAGAPPRRGVRAGPGRGCEAIVAPSGSCARIGAPPARGRGPEGGRRGLAERAEAVAAQDVRALAAPRRRPRRDGCGCGVSPTG